MVYVYPQKSMAGAFDVLDKDIDKKRGTGTIICLYDSKLYLKDNLIVLPIEYILLCKRRLHKSNASDEYFDYMEFMKVKAKRNRATA